MIEKELPLDVMRRIAMFSALSDSSLELLRDLLVLQKLSVGEVLFREGDAGAELFVVLSGELEVLKSARGTRDTRVALLGPTDVVGEMSMLDGKPRSATVRGLSPVKLGVLTGQSLDALYRRDLKGYAILILNMAREVSRRLRVADGLISSFAAAVSDVYASQK
jgi:CRP/FNR family transcriptional regulator, cyclic AMP receptor protein